MSDFNHQNRNIITTVNLKNATKLVFSTTKIATNLVLLQPQKCSKINAVNLKNATKLVLLTTKKATKLVLLTSKTQQN